MARSSQASPSKGRAPWLRNTFICLCFPAEVKTKQPQGQQLHSLSSTTPSSSVLQLRPPHVLVGSVRWGYVAWLWEGKKPCASCRHSSRVASVFASVVPALGHVVNAQARLSCWGHPNGVRRSRGPVTTSHRFFYRLFLFRHGSFLLGWRLQRFPSPCSSSSTSPCSTLRGFLLGQRLQRSVARSTSDLQYTCE